MPAGLRADGKVVTREADERWGGMQLRPGDSK
jgi:hypothetical protein